MKMMRGEIGRPRFWTEEKVEPALIAARGLFAETARLLALTYGVPCSHSRVCSIVNQSPRLRKIRETCMEAVLDICETQVMTRAELGDQKDQHFLLMTKGKQRGYCKHTQLSGVGPGGTIPVIDLTKLDDEELQRLEALLEKAA